MRFFLLLIACFFITSPVAAQEWTANAAFDQLLIDESLTAISTIFTHNERVFVSAPKSDFTNRLYYSDDTGASWTEVTTDNNDALYSVFASVDDNVIYSFGTDLFGSRYLRKSEDAGTTWTVQTSDYSNFPFNFIPTQLAATGETLIVSSTASDVGLFKSTDAGATWTSFIDFADDDDNKGIDVIAAQGDYFFLASLTQGLYQAHKDSSSWELLKSFKTSEGIDDDIHDLLVDEATGRIYIATTGSIEYSDDNGDNWTSVARADMGVSESGLFDHLALLDAGLIASMADASNPRVLLIENLNMATEIDEGLDYNNSSRFMSLKSTSSAAFGIRISQTSTLWQYGASMETSNEEGLDRLQKATLTQNYPNPFTGITQIGFTLPHAGPVRLRVLNLLGQEMLILQEGHLPAGTYSASLDDNALAAGVYLYTLETRSGTQTRSLTIVR